MQTNSIVTDSVSSAGAFRIIVAVHDNRAAVIPFVHALGLAYAAHGELEIVDVRPAEERIDSIRVRTYLEKWNLLPANSKRKDVSAAGLRVQKVVRSGNKKGFIKKRIRQHPHDLLVVGTEEKHSRTGIFGSSLAAYLAEYFHRSTLFLPYNSRPFVDPETGNIALKRILIPVDEMRFYHAAMMKLLQLAKILPKIEFEVTGIHVGGGFPQVEYLSHPRIHWKEHICEGTVPDVIVSHADAICADLVIMATDGRDSIVRTIYGSKTERLLNIISCPVLSVSVR